VRGKQFDGGSRCPDNRETLAIVPRYNANKTCYATTPGVLARSSIIIQLRQRRLSAVSYAHGGEAEEKKVEQ
jgi:hypothetical protein